MTNQDFKYNTLITKLQSAKPEVKDAAWLTDDIMLAISEMKHGRSHGIVFWLRPVMSAAALFLFGLFLYQSYDEAVIPQSDSRSNSLKSAFIKKEYCGTNSILNIQDKQSLVNEYLCYIKNSRIENLESKEMYLKILGKIQNDEIQ